MGVFIVIISAFLIFMDRKTTPEEAVKEIVNGYLEGKYVYGLNEERGQRIEEMVASHKDFEYLPDIVWNFEIWEEGDYFAQSTRIVTFDIPESEEVRAHVTVTFYGTEYEVYTGSILFRLTPDEETTWRVTNVAISEFDKNH